MITVTDTYSAPIAEFAEVLGINLATAVKVISLDLLQRIVFRTPVDTGRARASWDLTVGAPSNRVEPERDGSAGVSAWGGQRFTNAFSGGALEIVPPAAKDIDGTQPVWIVSNLDYIERLENGYSRQAPVGMVTISVVELESEVESLLAAAIKP